MHALLLHGAGGQGKTRLAIHFARLSAAAGWTVLRARHSADATVSAEPYGGAAGDDDRLLLVVDYADRWAHKHVEGLLCDPVLYRGGRVRVLLLGRSIRWWTAVRGALEELRVGADDMVLGAFGADPGGTPTRFPAGAGPLLDHRRSR